MTNSALNTYPIVTDSISKATGIPIPDIIYTISMFFFSILTELCNSYIEMCIFSPVYELELLVGMLEIAVIDDEVRPQMHSIEIKPQIPVV